MAKKVGTLIKEARTGAGMTQEQLAKKVKGVSASDIGKAERGEKDLTQEQLKLIAKATGVTQKYLLDAAKGTTTAKKTTSTAKKTTSTAKKTTTSTAKKTTTSSTSVKLTAAEKKLVELYREADADTKKSVMALLKGEEENNGLLGNLLGGKNNKKGEDILGNLIGGMFGVKK